MQIESISLKDAQSAIAAARTKASEIGQPMVIAVVGADGQLVALERMDGAWLGSIDVAINKAFTSRAFDMETGQLWEFAQSGGPAFGIQFSNGGRIMAFEGGVPLKRNNHVVGAIGVSGGYKGQDGPVAEAGAHALAH